MTDYTERMTPEEITEYFENYQKPWWWYRCVHRSHTYWTDPDGREYGCFKVIKEAEQVVVLWLHCLNEAHVLVHLDGAGHSCKVMEWPSYLKLSPSEEMELVRDQLSFLKLLVRE